MKNLILTIIAFVLLTLSVSGLEECTPVTSIQDIPCMVVSVWNYSNCILEKAVFYNESGVNFINYTFSDYGGSGLCNFTFNYSSIGSFTYKVTNGDQGNILVKPDITMVYAIIGSVLFIGLAFLLISFFIGKEFANIKVLSFFSSIAFFLLSLVFSFILLPNLPNQADFKLMLITTLTVFCLIVIVIIYFYMSERFIKVFDRLSGER